jgi:selenocysteine-specific elongation factor
VDSLVTAALHWQTLQDKTLQIVGEYHKTYPLRKGIPREELKSKLKLSPRVFNAMITLNVNRLTLNEFANLIAMPVHQVTFDNGQQAKVQGLMRKFAANPFVPPSVKECQAKVGEEIVNALIEMGELMAVSQEVIFRTSDYEAMVTKIKSALVQKGQVSLAEVRDLLGTTRKYVQALLEHLDAIGVTMREGDVRKLRK